MLFHAMMCYAVLSCALLRYAIMLCYATLYYAMLCCAMLYYASGARVVYASAGPRGWGTGS